MERLPAAYAGARHQTSTRRYPMLIQFFKGSYGRVEMGPDDGLYHACHPAYHRCAILARPEAHHQGRPLGRCKGVIVCAKAEYSCQSRPCQAGTALAPSARRRINSPTSSPRPGRARGRSFPWGRRAMAIRRTPLPAAAGNPYFIDLDLLIDDGLLKREEVESIDWGPGRDVRRLRQNIRAPFRGAGPGDGARLGA